MAAPNIDLDSTPERTWATYSSAWSNRDERARAAQLDESLADDVTYCDPNGLIRGRVALSAYMAGYQNQTPPGSHFCLRSVTHHHGRTLAQWAFVTSDGSDIYTGASFGALADDGRLLAITGFFAAGQAG